MQDNFVLKDFKALGTLWYIEVFDISGIKSLKKIKNSLEKTILDFEEKYSRFNKDSILNDLNKNKKVLYDEDLYHMLFLGEEFRVKTNGIFDIGIKENLEEIGYGEKTFEVENIKIKKTQRRFEKKGKYLHWGFEKQIDLGGVGKGYLIDKIAKILKEEFNVKYFLINGGGDIYLTSDNEKPISLKLEHPNETDKYIGEVRLKNQSMCASSSFKRMWTKNGQEYNHFIDIKNNKKVQSATFVISDNTVNADILATTIAIVSENQDLVHEIIKNENCEYLVITEDYFYGSKFFIDGLNKI